MGAYYHGTFGPAKNEGIHCNLALQSKETRAKTLRKHCDWHWGRGHVRIRHSQYSTSQLSLPQEHVSFTTIFLNLLGIYNSCHDSGVRYVHWLLSQPILTHRAAYFLVDEPRRDTQWMNNQPNLVQWQKGLLDGVNGFDVELARLNTDGLLLVAMNVPSQQNSLNIFLQNVPAGDDYFLTFMNSTHGTLLATSSRFSVLSAGSNPTRAGSSPNNAVPTVTISGTPDPTKLFATTFPALPDNGALGGRNGAIPGWVELVIMVLLTLASMIAGSAWTMS